MGEVSTADDIPDLYATHAELAPKCNLGHASRCIASTNFDHIVWDAEARLCLCHAGSEARLRPAVTPDIREAGLRRVREGSATQCPTDSAPRVRGSRDSARPFAPIRGVRERASTFAELRYPVNLGLVQNGVDVRGVLVERLKHYHLWLVAEPLQPRHPLVAVGVVFGLWAAKPSATSPDVPQLSAARVLQDVDQES